jgi:predicted nucleotidyltransferase
MNLAHYTKTSKKLARKHPDIEDIVLFGSCMKGKNNPQDIDILIIFKNTINKEAEYELKQTINEPKADINSTTTAQLQQQEHLAAEGVYLEGYSLLKQQPKAQELHMKAKAIIKYNTKHLNNTQKTKFHYALQGRNNNKGVLQTLQAKKISNNTIIVDYSQTALIEEFLNNWNVEYTTIPILTPARTEQLPFFE